MKISELLPIGSVVLLKEGSKKTMIFGVKQTSDDDVSIDYDYIGVMYPEGFLGGNYQFLFNHEDIQEVFFRGYEDEERNDFIERLSEYYTENE